jgi:Na+/H+-translocating membrane pyrophosphatase
MRALTILTSLNDLVQSQQFATMRCATLSNSLNAFVYTCMLYNHQLAIVMLITMFKYCSPVRDVADSCRTGAATNVIFGLALGYKSVIIPIFSIAIAIYVSFSLAAMYGISVAALGMLSTIATGLAIDAYGPISDNAGGIAEMAGMSHEIRERTDALDAAGNTTAAIGKVIFFFSGSILFY